jgi:hypothetical protein
MTKKLAGDSVRRQLEEAATEIERLGGWSGFKSGEWLFYLMEQTFRKYSESAASESFSTKYPNYSRAQIAHKLIEAASKKAALAGGITGLAVSADELVAFFTAGEAGVPPQLFARRYFSRRKSRCSLSRDSALCTQPLSTQRSRRSC